MMELVNSYNGLVNASLKRVIRDVFIEADTDGDGALTKKEFDTFSSSAKGILAINGVKIADTDEYYSEADADGNGKLTFAEFDKISGGTQSGVNKTTSVPNTAAMVMTMTVSNLFSKSSSGTTDTSNFFDNYVSTEQEMMNFTYGVSTTYNEIQEASQPSGLIFDSMF